jgi:hypothetical protein
MFESFSPSRLQHERELWIARRKSGKKTFVLSYTLIVSNFCFALFRIPLLCHFWYGRTISHHGKLAATSVILPLSIGAGLWLGLRLWRRGERIVSNTENAAG